MNSINWRERAEATEKELAEMQMALAKLREQIFPHDIEYVRKDAADKAISMMRDGMNHLIQQASDLRQELARYREREATMGWNQS